MRAAMKCAVKRAAGFTLIELIAVIAIIGILAGMLVVFLKPAIDSYFDTQRRGALTDMADTALRRMSQDIRSAVPNSLQTSGSSCFELVPTVGGGRYRLALDTQNAGSLPLDTATATTGFDVLGYVGSRDPAVSDWVVIDNQNTDDVYNGVNRGQIIPPAFQKPPPTPGGTTVGQSRITIASQQFPVGYDDGRFDVIPGSEATVSYACVGSTLYRNVTTTFGGPQCTAAGAVVATNVDCAHSSFTYSPSQGATQQSGFIAMTLVMLGVNASGQTQESVSLSYGVHVENLP